MVGRLTDTTYNIITDYFSTSSVTASAPAGLLQMNLGSFLLETS